MKNRFKAILFFCSTLGLFCCKDKKNVANEVIPPTFGDTINKHVLYFTGGYDAHNLLILNKKNVDVDEIIDENKIISCSYAYSTNSSIIRLLIFNKNFMFDSILRLDSFQKYILVVKEDSTIEFSQTDDIKRIMFR